MQTSRYTLADSWDCGAADNPPGSTALRRVRNALAHAALPTTARALTRPAGLSLARVLATLAVLEAGGEARLNKRGDTIHAFNPTTAPVSVAA